MIQLLMVITVACCLRRCVRLLLGLFEVAMVDALVVAQAVQGAVDALADVAHRLLGRSHVHVLYMPLETCQRAQVLVARIAAKIVTAARGIQTAAGCVQPRVV